MGKAPVAPATPLLTVEYLLVLLARMPVWSGIRLLLSPFWRLISMYCYVGGAARKVALNMRRLFVRLLGQLSAPCTGSFFRQLSYQLWLIRRWHVATAAIVAISLLHKLAKQWMDSRSPVAREKRRLSKVMETTKIYREWAEAASALDDLDMATMPRTKLEELRRHESRLYDTKLLEQHRSHLENARREGDMQKMMFSLRADLLRNLGNMTNSKLHERRPIVPGPIKSYIDEVAACLRTITTYEGPELSPEDKLSFLRETRHAFGRTALVLSGGGALGAFHLGIVKALLNNGLLPRVVAGSSVGSIISSLIATRTDEELKFLFDNLDTLDLSFFNNNSAGQLFAHLVTKGSLQDVTVLQHRLKCLIGDLTFQEAYERTGRILNVVVCAADTNEPPRLLNYLTAPQAIIWSAVAASSAFPLLYHPAQLLARTTKGEIVQYIGDWGPLGTVGDADIPHLNSRRWFDGSLEQDLPMRGLSEMFNVNYFLVSQANPHVVPLLYLKSKINSTLADVLESEWKHRCRQLQDLLPDWFPSKLLTLVSQTWEGDITVTLPYEYCQVGKAIINPTREGLYEAVLAGQRRTWAKLAAIQCNCTIEATLDQCLGIVVTKQRQRRRAQQAAGGVSRISSASTRYCAARAATRGPACQQSKWLWKQTEAVSQVMGPCC